MVEAAEEATAAAAECRACSTSLRFKWKKISIRSRGGSAEHAEATSMPLVCANSVSTCSRTFWYSFCGSL